MYSTPVRLSARRRAVAAIALLGSVSLALSTTLGTGPAEAAGARKGPATSITIDDGRTQGRVGPSMLGVNHRFVSLGHGLWDGENNRPQPLAVKSLKAARVSSVRYPGGVVANLFDWRKSIGATKGCQTNGREMGSGFLRARGQGYGPDEHMRLVREVGADTVMMVPWVTETPADAAGWVEYMNSPADGDARNPLGGTDWAELRAANGHPAPYNVRLWEIGNEQRTSSQRYWMSPDEDKALRQYTNGGERRITGEALGRACHHPNRGVPSNGQAGQVFELLYPPAAPGSVRVTVGANPDPWTAVDAQTLADAEPGDRFYVVDENDGEVRFGDGDNGAIPLRGTKVRASYRSVHKGVFAFIKAMKRVDPRINVCPAWGLKEFVRVAGRRRYECFSVHAYTNFGVERADRWRSPLEGHDLHMLGTKHERAFVTDLKRTLPAGVRIAMTEFGAIKGDGKTYPQWFASMSRATYMASMWVSWLDLRIPWTVGSDMITPTNRGLLGDLPHFTLSAEALTRQALQPVLSPGARTLKVTLRGNPERRPRVRAGRISARSYGALAVGATRRAGGDLQVVVVNRLPKDRQRVRATVNLDRFRSRRVAFVSRVNGPSFRSRNQPGDMQVKLKRSRQRIGARGFRYVFPAHSVTVFRIPGR
jgi:alpha-N-arabinofuranosidase